MRQPEKHPLANFAEDDDMCAHCAKPVTAAKVKSVHEAYPFSFLDDPPFCCVDCADLWHSRQADISDTYNYGDE